MKSGGGIWMGTRLLVIGLLLTGCGDGDNPMEHTVQSPELTAESDSTYSIKFFVTDADGKTTQHKAGPHLAETKAVRSAEAMGSQQQKLTEAAATDDESGRLGSSRQDLLLCTPSGGGTSSRNCEEAKETETTTSADILLKYAYESCRIYATTTLPDGERRKYNILSGYDSPWRAMPPQGADAPRYENWYFFAGMGRMRHASPDDSLIARNRWGSCDEILVGEEALLCVADRLAEIADAVDTIVWHDVGYYRPDSAGAAPFQPLTVRIPPQATKDRFITRDLALNVLGHLVRLDDLSPGWNTKVERMGGCSEAYHALTNGDVDPTLRPSILAQPSDTSQVLLAQYLRDSLDGGDNEATNAQRASNRLSYKAQILRAAARLTRDLVDKSLSGDMAGAEWQRAHAADPMQGLRSMWGQDPSNPDGYNSLEHALKVLFGRVENQRSTAEYFQGLVDPACNGLDSWDLVDGMGAGFDARWEAQSPATPGQSLAISTVARSGVVVPSSQLVADNASNLRKGVKARLIRQGALAQDADKTLTPQELSEFEQTMVGQSISTVLNAKSITDEDLLYGLNQAFTTYRLLTDSASDITTITAAAGLSLATSGVDASIAALGGAVVEGGLPRSELAGDITGVVGRAAAASQCDLQETSLWSQGNNVDMLFQSPFVVANVLGQHLDALGKLLSPLTLDGAKDAGNGATLAAGEVRAWAGDAVVMHGWGDYSASSSSGICPPSEVSGSLGFCSKECPCEAGEGACSSDDECGAGLVCYSWGNGTWWGMPHDYGVCVPKTSCADWLDADATHGPSTTGFCDRCKCAAGKGDCDGDDAACKPGLSCIEAVGSKFGLGSGDVCLPAGFPVASCPTRPTTYSVDYCSSSCPCLAGQGDVDSSSQCFGSTRPQSNVGHQYDISNGSYDMCVPAYKTNMQTFVLSGVQPKDFGVTTSAQLVNKISLVFGQPWMAECVAGRRNSCPADLSATSTFAGFHRVDLNANNTTTSLTGFQGRPGPTLVTKFMFDPGSVTGGEANLWYVIVHGDATSGRNEGRILATLARGRLGASTMEVVSAYRDQRSNEIFGLSARPQSTQTCTDVGSTSLPGNYCIEGMQRDMFVPLANELTSQGGAQEDSWRHYLALAEEAAREADELGRQLIEAGKERDRKKLEDQVFDYNREVTLQQRREAAQEKLAELCGAFVDQNKVKLDSNTGEFTVAEDQAEVAACIAASKVDLVFLGPDPFANAGSDFEMCDLRGCKDSIAFDTSSSAPPADLQVFIRQLYCNGKNASELSAAEQQTLPPFCMNTIPITTAGLNIAAVPQPFSIDTCEGISDVNEGINSTAPTHNRIPGALIGQLTAQPWATAAGIGASLARLQYRHSVDGGWGVTVYGRPILGNRPWLDHWFPTVDRRTIYPVCEVESDGCRCAAGQERSCTVRALRAMFGGSSGSSEEEVRLNVERALWHMGALAGQIPQGTFYLTLPVANLKSDADASMPPAIYSHGVFVKDTLTTDKYDLEESNPDSPLSVRTFLGQATPMPVGFAERLKDTSRKPWLRNLYLDAFTKRGTDGNALPSYLAIGAANSYISFNDRFWSFNELSRPTKHWDELVGLTRASLPEWIKEFARAVDGQTCASVTGVQLPITALSANVPVSTASVWPFDSDLRVSNDDDLVYFGRAACGGQGASQADAERVLVESGSMSQSIWVRGAGNTRSSLARDNQLTFVLGDQPFSATGGPCPPEPVAIKETCQGGTCTTEATDDEKRDNCLEFSSGFYFGAVYDECIKAGTITRECLNSWDQLNQNGREFDYHRFPARQLRPDVCRPDQRVEFFVDRGLRNECDATLAVTQSLGLSCLAAKAPAKGLIAPPPQVTNLSQLQQLEAWLEQARENMSRAASAIYLMSMPKQSIKDFQGENLSTSSVGKGNHGALMFSLHASLLGMSNAWTNLELSLAQIQDSVALAKAHLEQNRLLYEARLDQNDIQRIELNRQDAMRAVAGAGKTLNQIIGAVGGGATAAVGVYTGNPVAAIGGLQAMASSCAGLLGNDPDDEMAAAEAQYNGEIRGVLDRLSSNAADTKGVEDLISLLGLSKDTKAEFRNANDALYQLRLHSLTALGTLNLLSLNREKAKWQLGIIAGAGFVEFKGKATSQEINNVLARQYDGQRIRYERALERAKRAAYLARLAIEQRLGVRFAGVSQPIGPLRQAPSVWIDDICTLQGIDYNALKTNFDASQTTGGGAEPLVDEITTHYADSFIGDYVDRLKELVEFYNLEQPFRESDDVAVLSFRDDLLNGNASCSRESKNELFYSDSLYKGGVVDENLSSHGGWRINRCDGADCLDVANGHALNAALGFATGTGTSAASQVLPPGGMGEISWFRAYTTTAPPPALEGEVAPTKSVYQSVELQGSQEYVVSWWDMARALDGSVPSATNLGQYVINIYDSSWRLVGGDTFVGTSPGATGNTWSDRHELNFVTTSDGTYHLAFRLLSTTASVAIANVQLEKAPTAGAHASYYDANDNRRMEHNSECDAVNDLSRFFRYQCEGVGTAKSCYWELNKLIRLDTESLNQGTGPLVGKVGIGNYNHRLLTTAVNVVGTGVLDCARDPRASCYGSSYLEYDLDHAAFRIPIDDYAGAVRCFDFGNGTIRGAKALASERFITTPLSSADAQLVQQPAFSKQELSGRPLSGQYRFRIKDTPALQWANVEDIQLMFTYRYWARVGRGSN